MEKPLDIQPNQVYSGDAVEVMDQLPENSVGLSITSPPYYNAKEYAHWTTYAEYLIDVKRWLAAIYRVLQPGRRLVWQVDDLLKSKEFRNCTISADSVILAKEVGFTVKTKIVWRDKMNADGWLPGTYPNGPNIVINWCLEDLWVFQKPDDWPNHKGRYPVLPPELAKYDVMDSAFLIKYARNPVWDIRAESAKTIGHPAPFPEELVEPCIRMWSRPGDLVLDPFGGSGTTALSALKWRRKYWLIERHPPYVKLCNRRIDKRRIELLTDQLILPDMGVKTMAEFKHRQAKMDLRKVRRTKKDGKTSSRMVQADASARIAVGLGGDNG